MAEPLNKITSQIEFDFQTKNENVTTQAVDNILKKLTDLQSKADKITNTFDRMFSKLTDSTNKFVKSFSDLNNQFSKFNVQITQIQPKIPTITKLTQPYVPPQPSALTSAYFGGSVFTAKRQELLEQEQIEQAKKQRREHWYRWGMDKLQMGVNVGGQMAGQMASSNYTGVLTSGLRGIGAALPLGLGVFPSFFAMKYDIMRNLWMQRAAQEASVLNVQGLAGSYSRGANLLWSGVNFGYANPAVAAGAETFLRAGGRNLNVGEIQRQMRLARSYGIEFGQVAQVTGELERYGDRGRTGLYQARNIMGIAQQANVTRPLMSEFLQFTTQAFKQAIADGVQIKNPRVFAESLARFERAGYTGIAAQQGFQRLQGLFQGATNVSNVGQALIMSSILRYGRGERGERLDAFEAMARAQEGGTPRNIRAMEQDLRVRLGRRFFSQRELEREVMYRYMPGEALEARRLAKMMLTGGGFRREQLADTTTTHVERGMEMAATAQNLRSQMATYSITTDKIMAEASNMEAHARNIVIKVAQGATWEAIQDMFSGPQDRAKINAQRNYLIDRYGLSTNATNQQILERISQENRGRSTFQKVGRYFNPLEWGQMSVESQFTRNNEQIQREIANNTRITAEQVRNTNSSLSTTSHRRNQLTNTSRARR